ncbi:winged helix-turn-helix domain-containing protein [Saxibacter everestensis]|uniref:Winged helix-turn-helix domain-containing protein n=1 Tax=Saxibacter everestensis TaxID=2909229 RepID=A0ABY8QS36_9MICO|nr:winged helix-turn-helix domain-containing protein [Brevibacteriaceae bacterium ZFBP1038]
MNQEGAMEPTVPSERRAATDAEAKALGSGVRLRILRLCLDETLTNREIAAELDLNPATSLHHVRTLAATGFLEALEARRGRRGAQEIPYRATGKSWFMDAGDITNPLLEAFVAELNAAPFERRTMGRLAIRLPEAEVDELRERIDELLEEFRARPRDPRAEQWAIFVAMHPSSRQTPPSTSEEVGAHGEGPNA